MNDIFKSLLAKANRNLISECAELRAKLEASEASVKRLEELADKWAIDAARESERADNLWKRADRAEARILELNRALDAARQQGGAK